MSLSGVIMALAVSLCNKQLYNIMPKNNLYLLINIIISTAVGALVYVGMLIILKTEELQDLIKLKFKK
jgi:putative peptidoglycan lipid II flippase